MKNVLLLIDGSSYFYRAFHALPPLNNSQGHPTGAVYGVLNMIRRLLKDVEPAYFAVVFDTKGKTFRDDLYPEYKANRAAMPDDLQRQFEPLVEIIQALGLPLIMETGIEADDVIGTLAKRAEAEGLSTIISTGDKDMAQLVNENITLVNTMSNTRLDINGVIEKFGVPPELIVDYLTLVGDSVDNVPGVKNVGPKTAVKWLTAYGTLDDVINNADKITGKVGENLRESLGFLPLAKTLVTIKVDCDFVTKPTTLVRQSENTEKLISLYKQWEFKTWLADALKKPSSLPSQTVSIPYDCILTEAAWKSWLDRLKKSTAFCFDTETTDLNVMDAKLVGLSFSLQSGEAAYIPLSHDYENAPTQLSLVKIIEDLKPVFADKNTKKIAHNLKYDLNILFGVDLTCMPPCFDTMLASYVLNSTAVRHDMDSLSLKYLGKTTITFEDVAGKGSHQKTFNQVEIEPATNYAAEDADITLQLYDYFSAKLAAEPGLTYIFEQIEMPLVPILAKMERRGVLIDVNKLEKQSIVLAERINALENEIYLLAGESFNIASPKQLQTILFDKLGLPMIEKTPTGQPSTAESVLSELALSYELPQHILSYRSLTKLKSTYTDSLPKQINAKTGRVHTSYNQAVAATGRLSSTDPNLQNIPIRSEEGRQIREAFIAPPGNVIVSIDYSQIELRIMAHLTGDKTLCQAFSENRDIHAATAAEIFSVPLAEVTPLQRRSAKTINFGLIYGMSAFGLAKQLGLSREAAQDYIKIYFDRYPGVKNYMESTKAIAMEKGYVETIFGRRLYLPDIKSKQFQRQRAAERTAINAPMQGSAADIIKLAMIAVDKWISDEKIPAHLIMQVHDELVFEVKSEVAKAFAEKAAAIMSQVGNISIPLSASIGIGPNWGNAH